VAAHRLWLRAPAGAKLSRRPQPPGLEAIPPAARELTTPTAAGSTTTGATSGTAPPPPEAGDRAGGSRAGNRDQAAARSPNPAAQTGRRRPILGPAATPLRPVIRPSPCQPRRIDQARGPQGLSGLSLPFILIFAPPCRNATDCAREPRTLTGAELPGRARVTRPRANSCRTAGITAVGKAKFLQREFEWLWRRTAARLGPKRSRGIAEQQLASLRGGFRSLGETFEDRNQHGANVHPVGAAAMGLIKRAPPLIEFEKRGAGLQALRPRWRKIIEALAASGGVAERPAHTILAEPVQQHIRAPSAKSSGSRPR
jgi:hypothetical protein